MRKSLAISILPPRRRGAVSYTSDESQMDDMIRTGGTMVIEVVQIRWNTYISRKLMCLICQ